MTIRDIPALLGAIWRVWRGKARRIAMPAKFKVWREARGVMIIEVAQ